MSKYEQIFKDGYIESELTRLAANSHREMLGGDYRHAIGMLAAALLLVLERTERAEQHTKRKAPAA